MRRDVVENLLIRYAGKQTRSIFLDEQRRLAHYVTANSATIRRLNGVTRNARHAIVIERPLHFGVFRQRAGEERCRVVTRFAMARELNSFLRLNVFDIFLLKRLTKCVSMR